MVVTHVTMGSNPIPRPKKEVAMRIMLKSKIHGIKVTDVNAEYHGSISIDAKLLKKVDIMEYEQVHVLDVTNGARFETYAIKGAKGECCVNGAAARLVNFDDVLIVLAYGLYDSVARYHKPKILEL